MAGSPDEASPLAAASAWYSSLTLLVLSAAGIATVRAGDPPTSKQATPVELIAIPPRLVDRLGDPLPAGAILRLGTTRLRHADVCTVAFTADQKLVSFGRDYVLRTWDPVTGRQLAERAFEKEKVYRTSAGYLSPEARRLAIQLENRVKVFDAESARQIAAVTLTDAH